jgi:peptidoglycan/LPS O-acetylase OafA/YrhL
MTRDRDRTLKSAERLDWLDATRGLAIVAVIAYHVDLGMVLSHIPMPEYLHGWLAAADLVRMPLREPLAWGVALFVGLALFSYAFGRATEAHTDKVRAAIRSLLRRGTGRVAVAAGRGA